MLEDENLHFLSGNSPFISIDLPVGVSLFAVHSISASNRLLPDPVGPTMEIISLLFIVIVPKLSAFPLLSLPPIIERDSTESSFSSPRNSSISPMYSMKSILIFSISIAHSSISSSLNPFKNSSKVFSSWPAISRLLFSKNDSTKGYSFSISIIFISIIFTVLFIASSKVHLSHITHLIVISDSFLSKTVRAKCRRH